jgi:hypothetical protein
MEIERKFLVKELPKGLECCNKLEIEQGYISEKPTIRIRKADERYILTVKSKFGVCNNEGDPIVNNESETEITKKEYEALKEKLVCNTLRKTRYIIPLADGLVAELDVFKDRLCGLVFAEVEFPSVEEANRFNKPEWLGMDVSNDKRYRNSNIVKLNNYSKEYFEEDV